ncbi:hypothetical protein DNU06_08500 [Putridiphycobacter roseus]|uniref:Glutamine cyclotransferase n=1 Tax=Putridiphycobacter roseus TaxID=2219161 RepID=A0A2W1N2T5_9FLAO|nr:glutaminyl-peptide cyclotransferase [Putridiphycobacter roseus]PZE17301.1 hypothetical protein DNU06_08500 [Putridiphycobacter roseus]
MKYPNIIKLILISILAISNIQCTEDIKPTRKSNKASLKILSPKHNQQYTIGDFIQIDLEVLDPSNIKTLAIYINDTLYKANVSPKTQTIKIPTVGANVGLNTLYFSFTDQAGKERGATRNLILFSDIIPAQKIASIVKAYPHQNTSYTQGLEFYDNALYESTGSGDYAKSFIAKVNINSGKHIAIQPLDTQYFGEGITILNDTIYQLVWQKQKCFVYTLDFKPIKSFDYEGEGWGLTNNGKSIIMSNGTAEIVWRNPNTFAIEKRIYAFSDQSDFQNLNELELIEDKLLANVYTQNYIIEIDTNNGKVLSKIDCAGIVAKGMVGNANVLNGIAYNPNTKKTYFTGKLWQYLYEIQID